MAGWRILLALTAVSMGAAVAAEDPFDVSVVKLNAVANLVTNRVGEVEALLSRSKRESTALRSSCIQDKLQLLRAKQGEARADAKTFGGLRSNPIEQSKLIEHSRVTEVYSAALVRDARKCADAQSTQTRIEVKLGNNSQGPGPLPGATPIPPPRYDRPPLASPL